MLLLLLNQPATGGAVIVPARIGSAATVHAPVVSLEIGPDRAVTVTSTFVVSLALEIVPAAVANANTVHGPVVGDVVAAPRPRIATMVSVGRMMNR